MIAWSFTARLFSTQERKIKMRNCSGIAWDALPNIFSFKVQAEEVKTCQGLQKTGKGTSMYLVPYLFVCWFDAKSLTIKVRTTMRIQNWLNLLNVLLYFTSLWQRKLDCLSAEQLLGPWHLSSEPFQLTKTIKRKLCFTLSPGKPLLRYFNFPLYLFQRLFYLQKPRILRRPTERELWCMPWAPITKA